MGLIVQITQDKAMELVTDSETSGHRSYRFLSWDYFLQVPNYQDFQIIGSQIR